MSPRDGILILDPEEARVVDANPFLSELLGYEREELVGRPVGETGIFADDAEAQSLLHEARQEGCVRRDGLTVRARSGETLLVDVVAYLYRVDDRAILQLNVSDAPEQERAAEAGP